MKLRRSAILAALGLALLAAPAVAEVHEVLMTTVDFEPVFVPASLDVEPGDTVRWINADPFLLDHRVASGTGSADPSAGLLFDSGLLATAEFFEFTFGEAGDYEFFSVPHEFEGMFGVVHVGTSTSGPNVEHTTWGKVKHRFSLLLPRD